MVEVLNWAHSAFAAVFGALGRSGNPRGGLAPTACRVLRAEERVIAKRWRQNNNSFFLSTSEYRFPIFYCDCDCVYDCDPLDIMTFINTAL
eukprot:560060-Rhodomonas_salina.1